eukprot:6189159-Pleurochrysis_carterae.AAC.3
MMNEPIVTLCNATGTAMFNWNFATTCELNIGYWTLRLTSELHRRHSIRVRCALVHLGAFKMLSNGMLHVYNGRVNKQISTHAAVASSSQYTTSQFILPVFPGWPETVLQCSSTRYALAACGHALPKPGCRYTAQPLFVSEPPWRVVRRCRNAFQMSYSSRLRAPYVTPLQYASMSGMIHLYTQRNDI